MSLDKQPSRREALKLLAGAVALPIAGLKTSEAKASPGNLIEAAGELSFLEVTPRPQRYPMGELARVWVKKQATKKSPAVAGGITFRGNVADYTGIHGRVPPVAHIDFKYQLSQIWRKKLGKIEKKDGQYPPKTLAAIRELFSSYNPDTSHKMDILQYQGRIGQAINSVRATVSLDRLKEIPAFRNLDENQMQLVKELEKRITAMSLLSCSATELVPTDSHDKTGIQVYDFLLRKAGCEYVENGMAALSDSAFSFGPYQLTPGVFHNDKENRPQGAKLIDRIATRPNIPDTIHAVRGETHHKAAYLFAIHNIALLARRLNSNRSARIVQYLPELPPEFVTELVAVAHHGPEDALTACENFLARYDVYASDRVKYEKPDFVESCRNITDLGPYADRTRNNFGVLRDYFRKEQVKLPSL